MNEWTNEKTNHNFQFNRLPLCQVENHSSDFSALFYRNQLAHCCKPNRVHIGNVMVDLKGRFAFLFQLSFLSLAAISQSRTTLPSHYSLLPHSLAYARRFVSSVTFLGLFTYSCIYLAYSLYTSSMWMCTRTNNNSNRCIFPFFSL